MCPTHATSQLPGGGGDRECSVEGCSLSHPPPLTRRGSTHARHGVAAVLQGSSAAPLGVLRGDRTPVSWKWSGASAQPRPPPSSWPQSQAPRTTDGRACHQKPCAHVPCTALPEFVAPPSWHTPPPHTHTHKSHLACTVRHAAGRMPIEPGGSPKKRTHTVRDIEGQHSAGQEYRVQYHLAIHAINTNHSPQPASSPSRASKSACSSSRPARRDRLCNRVVPVPNLLPGASDSPLPISSTLGPPTVALCLCACGEASPAVPPARPTRFKQRVPSFMEP